MTGMQRLRYLFLVGAVVVIAIGVFASITVVIDFTPMSAITLGMIAYCFGLGTIFVFVFLRLRKGYRETVRTLAKEDDKSTEKPRKTEEKEAEY